MKPDLQLLQWSKTKHLFYCSINFITALVSCAINAAIYFIAAFISFYCTKKTTLLQKICEYWSCLKTWSDWSKRSDLVFTASDNFTVIFIRFLTYSCIANLAFCQVTVYCMHSEALNFAPTLRLVGTHRFDVPVLIFVGKGSSISASMSCRSDKSVGFV